MLYHELLLKAAAAMEVTLPEPLADSKDPRTTFSDMFRNAQWICRFTFKENDLDANFLRALVCFNNVKLPDEEAVQQDNTATSAMRVMRSFDCLLSKADTSPFQVKLRMAGPASVVNWMLQGSTGEIHQVVLAQTEQIGEWSVLWQVPVDAAAKDTVMNYFDQLAMAELAVDEPLTFEPKWTPVKRLHVVRDNMPEEARSSKAWLNTLPKSSEVAATQCDEAM